MSAPSAGNQQPWSFLVIEDRNILDKIPEVHPSSKMLYEAPVAIVVLGDPSLEKYKGYWIQDCSAATENILLAATGLGLGSVWLGVHPIEERINGVKKLLQIPDNINPLCIIAIGYPNEEKEFVDRYNEDRIYYNTFSNKRK